MFKESDMKLENMQNKYITKCDTANNKNGNKNMKTYTTEHISGFRKAKFKHWLKKQHKEKYVSW